VGDQTQLKDKENQDQSQKVVENKAEQAPDEPKSVENQKVTRERLERMKKAFRPSWLIDQINSLESKKGK
jgi:hypothetical protein